MFDAYDLNDPDPEKRELASVQLVDELFGPGLLDRLARLGETTRKKVVSGMRR